MTATERTHKRRRKHGPGGQSRRVLGVRSALLGQRYVCEGRRHWSADMILRDGSNGRYEIYDIGNNAILAGDFLGQVAINWSFVTLGSFNGSDTTDMLLRDNMGGGLPIIPAATTLRMCAEFILLPKLSRMALRPGWRIASPR